VPQKFSNPYYKQLGAHDPSAAPAKWKRNLLCNKPGENETTSGMLFEPADFSAFQNVNISIGGENHETEHEKVRCAETGSQECEGGNQSQQAERPARKFYNASQKSNVGYATHIRHEFLVFFRRIPAVRAWHRLHCGCGGLLLAIHSGQNSEKTK